MLSEHTYIRNSISMYVKKKNKNTYMKKICMARNNQTSKIGYETSKYQILISKAGMMYCPKTKKVNVSQRKLYSTILECVFLPPINTYWYLWSYQDISLCNGKIQFQLRVIINQLLINVNVITNSPFDCLVSLFTKIQRNPALSNIL